MIRQSAIHLDLASGHSTVRAVVEPAVFGPVDYALRVADLSCELVIGSGVLAGSGVPGSNRLVIVGWSPLWQGPYISTMGGAGEAFDDLGASYLVLRGRAPRPVAVVLRGPGDVRLCPVDPEAAWSDGRGVYGLLEALHDEHAGAFRSPRVLAVGPAARLTLCGAIASRPVMRGRMTKVDTWAGRGGLGSVLAQRHGVHGLVFGAVPPADAERGRYDAAFRERFQRDMDLVALEKTVKYRFDPRFGSGGTFGTNYHRLGDKALGFNHATIYLDDAAREGIHERLIRGHYLAQFDREIVAENKHHTCGEQCALACKKVDGERKKDFEPYAALGPNCGVYDQRAAELLNARADSLGFDAIELGGTVAFVLELLGRGLFEPRELGVSACPRWNPLAFGDAVGDSAHNASVGLEVIEHLMHDAPERGLGPLRALGLRGGAATYGTRSGVRCSDLAVVVAHGPSGGVVPAQYWVPGMFAPMAVMGKYFVYYGYEFHPPEELGRLCAARMVRELMLDNLGMCRFHRGWAEELVGTLVARRFGVEVDLAATHLALARRLEGFNRPVAWESERVVDVIATYLAKIQRDGPPEPELDRWVRAFAADKRAAAQAYWEALRAGVVDGLRSPQPEAEITC